MKLKDLAALFPNRNHYLLGVVLPSGNYFFDLEEQMLSVYGDYEVKEVHHHVATTDMKGKFSIEPIFVLGGELHE